MRAYLGLTVGVLSLLVLSEAARVSKLERFMEEVHIFLMWLINNRRLGFTRDSVVKNETIYQCFHPSTKLVVHSAERGTRFLS